MFNTSYVENALEGGVAMLEVLGKDAQAMAFVPMRRIEVSGEVSGPVAGMQVVHVFSYTKHQCSRVIEAAYRFPLPGDAAVTGVSVRFGDVEIQAVLEPRAQAEKDYEDAKKDRRQASQESYQLKVALSERLQESRVFVEPILAFPSAAKVPDGLELRRVNAVVPVRIVHGKDLISVICGHRTGMSTTVLEACKKVVQDIVNEARN